MTCVPLLVWNDSFRRGSCIPFFFFFLIVRVRFVVKKKKETQLVAESSYHSDVDPSSGNWLSTFYFTFFSLFSTYSLVVYCLVTPHFTVSSLRCLGVVWYSWGYAVAGIRSQRKNIKKIKK